MNWVELTNFILFDVCKSYKDNEKVLLVIADSRTRGIEEGNKRKQAREREKDTHAHTHTHTHTEKENVAFTCRIVE
jgi:hypothetical protein